MRDDFIGDSHPGILQTTHRAHDVYGHSGISDSPPNRKHPVSLVGTDPRL